MTYNKLLNSMLNLINKATRYAQSRPLYPANLSYTELLYTSNTEIDEINRTNIKSGFFAYDYLFTGTKDIPTNTEYAKLCEWQRTLIYILSFEKGFIQPHLNVSKVEKPTLDQIHDLLSTLKQAALYSVRTYKSKSIAKIDYNVIEMVHAYRSRFSDNTELNDLPDVLLDFENEFFPDALFETDEL